MQTKRTNGPLGTNKRYSNEEIPASQKIQEFALIVEPLKIRGGTGSTVAPIAVR